MDKIIENKITKKDLFKTFIRLNMYSLSLNFERMQALGFAFVINPILKKLYKNKSKEEKAKAIQRHLEFFNTNPWALSLIVGVTAALEESTSEDEKDSITSVKTGLMGPLAGVGDSLIQFTIYPLLASIGAAMAVQGNILGPIFFLVAFTGITLPLKYYGIVWGYKKGAELFQSAAGKTKNILQRIADMANIVGLMVVGSLIVTTVKINVPLKYVANKTTLKVQDMLNSIMPNLLPLLITILCFYILKKSNGKKVVWLIFSIMIVAVILSTFGIIG